jgi:putative nucleotidyltransferase with HDIG domain
MTMQPQLDKIVILLSSGIAQRKLYFADHPKVKSLGTQFVDLLQKYLKAIEQEALFIGVVDGKLVHEGHYLVGPSIAGGQLVRLAELLQCGGISFDQKVTAEEITALLGLAAELKDPVDDLSDARDLFAARGLKNVTVAAQYHDVHGLASEDEKVTWQGKDHSGGHLESPVLIYQALYDVVTSAHGNAALNRMLDIDSARSVSEYLLHSTRASFTDIIQLMHYPDYDSYTVGHSVRVATLSVHVGDHLGLDDEQLLELGTAGLLHDVGKSKIPDEILFKPGRLDKEEYSIIQTHARLGAEILMEHKTATPMDVAAAWGHHLRYDGGGYPTSPSWAARNSVTALLQVCDVFEALTAIRPYKAPMTPREAYEIMLKDEGAFAPGVLHAFIRTLGLYPPGNHVRLSDGSRATVVEAGTDIERPQVQLTHDDEGHPVLTEEDEVIDLGAPGQGAELSVEDLLLDPMPT